jgi:hypothetical protein
MRKASKRWMPLGDNVVIIGAVRGAADVAARI